MRAALGSWRARAAAGLGGGLVAAHAAFDLRSTPPYHWASGALVMPAMRALDPETAHNAAIAAAAAGLAPVDPATLRGGDPVLATTVWGLRFASPVGLAAGFDKHAQAVDGLLGTGFGFVEIGSVTPQPQPGAWGEVLGREEGRRERAGRGVRLAWRRHAPLGCCCCMGGGLRRHRLWGGALPSPGHGACAAGGAPNLQASQPANLCWEWGLVGGSSPAACWLRPSCGGQPGHPTARPHTQTQLINFLPEKGHSTEIGRAHV